MNSGDVFGRADERAAALIADLEKLVYCGLIVAIWEPGGATRYDVAARSRDHTGDACGLAADDAVGTVFDGG
jgi:hypothetical protein